MRKVLYTLSEIRKAQLDKFAKSEPSKRQFYDQRIAEVDDKFRAMDANLGGIGRSINNTELISEVMTSGDFTYG